MFKTELLHPMIVHFPIALIITGFCADVVSLFFKNEKCLSKTGFYLMLLGAVAAIVAWTTGQLFTDHPTEGAILSIFMNHKTLALVTMLVMIVGSAFRVWLVVKKLEDTKLKWIPFGFYLLAFLLVSITGFLGGKMVFEYMIAL